MGNLTGTTSLEAYELYLKGIQQWHLREAASLRESERLFLASVQIDPEFAKAHAGLAMTYAVMPSYCSRLKVPTCSRPEGRRSGRSRSIQKVSRPWRP